MSGTTLYPAPGVPAFLAGYKPQQADFTGWWTDTAGFLQEKVVFRAAQTLVATSLPSAGTTTVIAFDTILEDPYQGWNAAALNWTPPAAYSGWYHVSVTVRTAAAAALCDLEVNALLETGSTSYPLCLVQLGTSGGGGGSGSQVLYMTGAQQSVQATASLGNAGAAVQTSLTAGQTSTMEIVWISQS